MRCDQGGGEELQRAFRKSTNWFVQSNDDDGMHNIYISFPLTTADTPYSTVT